MMEPSQTLPKDQDLHAPPPGIPVEAFQDNLKRNQHLLTLINTKQNEYCLRSVNAFSIFFLVTSLYLASWDLFGINVEDADSKDMIDSQRSALEGSTKSKWFDSVGTTLWIDIEENFVELERIHFSGSAKEPRGFGGLRGASYKGSYYSGKTTATLPPYTENTTSKIVVRIWDTDYPLKVFRVKTNFDEDTREVSRLSAIAIIVYPLLDSTTQDAFGIWKVTGIYEDVWKGSIAHSTESFPAKSESLQVTVRDISEPRLVFPKFSGSWKLYLALASITLFLILICVSAIWKCTACIRNFNLSTYFYISDRKFRGW